MSTLDTHTGNNNINNIKRTAGYPPTVFPW